jgi:Xaa-Pro aminopeptidase
MDILRLTNEHSTAALRFALVASVIDTDKATPAETQQWEAACDAVAAALERVMRHVPSSATELRLQADYLAARLAMGDQLPPDLLAAHFRAVAIFNLPHHA